MRAAIFIDGGYIQTQLKMHEIDADYAELADYFLSPLRASFPLDLLRCYYYYCAPYMSPEPTDDELKRMESHTRFVEEIQSLGRWAMRLGKLQKRWEGQREVYEQKRVDVLLSVDLVRHAAAGHIQHAVLVAGDSDFVPAVEAAKEHGVTLTLWCGQGNTVHRDLVALADEVYVFDWSEFPRIMADGEGQDDQGKADGQQKRRRRRRRGRGGRGMSQVEGVEVKASAPSPVKVGPIQSNRGGRPSVGSSGRIQANNLRPLSDKKLSWRERFKRLTGQK